MYVTTFYSFKGGVGRTFALVNVGVELARTGRKVLLVDFDLEAPGIHTFDALSPDEPHPGMVECVTDYVATQSSPDVRQYVYEKNDVAEQGGRMWIMPAGRGDHEYRRRLASINWQRLYNEQDGYLFFEDLKAQWKEAFDPDYVLIDSRTGHTDVEGICTRQLPDAAVILFFPNEQNLCGLREVVNDIKAESERTRKDRAVTLHFVMSNVPDLDDEDGILRGRIEEFRRVLGCETPCRIHSYPSLALLNQTIFTKKRARSRLAREYRRLKDLIVDQNDEDPEGVVRFLKDFVTTQAHGSRTRLADADQRLKSICEKHSDNGEVNFLLGLVSSSQGDLTDAVVFFDRARDLGYKADAVLVERATCYAMLGNHRAAAENVQELLDLSSSGGYEFYRAVQLLRESDKRLLDRVPGSPAFDSLDVDEKWMIARTLYEKGAIAVSADVLRILDREPNVSRVTLLAVRNYLVLSLIALCRYDEAMSVISAVRPLPSELDVADAFNYAMAEWAKTGHCPREFFTRVIELVGARKATSANFAQCSAIAFWAVGLVGQAEDQLKEAERLGQRIRKTAMSCWRYREVTKDTFLEDCKAIRELINTGKGRPLFFPTEQ